MKEPEPEMPTRCLLAAVLLGGLFLPLVPQCPLLSPGDARADEPPLTEEDYDKHARQVVPRDTFPVLFDPSMTKAADVGERLAGDDLVIGVTHGTKAKAYPVQVMGVHELVNDTLDGLPIAASW